MVKTKLLLSVLVWIVILLSGISFVAAEEIREESFELPLPPREVIRPPESLIYPIVFLLFFLILSVILLYVFRKKINKVGAIIGGLYASIPSLLVIEHFLTHGTLGDPGPAWTFIIPIFWPAGVTWFFPGFLLSVLSASNPYVFGSIVNIVIWIFLGSFIGGIFKRKNENLIRDIGLLGGLAGLLIFTPLVYFYGYASISGLVPNLILIVSITLIGVIIGALIGFLIKNRRK